MSAALQRIGLSLLLAAGLCAGPGAEAGKPKYITLKVGERIESHVIQAE